MLLNGDIIGDRFCVEQMIGRGGLSAVFRVRHRQLGSVYALKMLLLHRPEISRRLLLEGQIQSRIRHPNVLSVTDIVEHQGSLGLVMEYVEPPALSEWLAAYGRMDLDLALSFFAPVLSALITAHDGGVLHRDLKPANILMARAPGGAVPKVADFGIAKVWMEDVGPDATLAGLPMGTPGYMPNEQIRDSRSVDARADLYALGSVLFEMLAGVRPIEGDTADLLMSRTMAGMRRDLRELVPDLPESVQVAIDRVLALEPEDRYADGREFAAALFVDRPDLLASIYAPEGRPVPIPLDQFPPSLNPATSLGGGTHPDIRPSLSAETLEQSALLPLTEAGPGASSRRSSGLGWLGLSAGIGVATLLLGVGAWVVMRSQEPAAPADPMVDVGATAPTTPTTEAPAEASPAEAAPVVADASPVAASAKETPTEARNVLSKDGATPAAPSTAPTEAIVADAAPEPSTATAVTVVEVPAVAPPTEAPPPEVAPPSYPTLAGTWSGQASDRELTLRITGQSEGRFQGEIAIQLGPDVETWPVAGDIDPDGSLRFTEMGGPGLQFSGKLSGGKMSGTYGRGSGKRQSWSASR